MRRRLAAELSCKRATEPWRGVGPGPNPLTNRPAGADRTTFVQPGNV